MLACNVSSSFTSSWSGSSISADILETLVALPLFAVLLLGDDQSVPVGLDVIKGRKGAGFGKSRG
jgi:hypothetical protein